METKEYLKKRIEIIEGSIKSAVTKKDRKYQEGKLAEAKTHLLWEERKEVTQEQIDKAAKTIDVIISFFKDVKKDMYKEMFVPDIKLDFDAYNSVDGYVDEQGFECGVDNGARSITIDIPPYKRFR